jgi:hypothetical protein
MSKFIRALELGFEILGDIEMLVNGQAASFSFSWQGRHFTVAINPNAPTVTQ